MWLMGYDNQSGLPYGGTNIDFLSGTANVYYQYRDMSFRMANSNISDFNGNVQFYTNGYYIANSSGDTMQNGTGLNPSQYTSWYPDGLSIIQANLIIPMPNSANLYYLFHSTLDNLSNSTALQLYYSLMDMSLNNGLGEVILKNQVIISDQLSAGKISACKHANGRDWWVTCHKANSNSIYKLLITPYAILGPYIQNIGIIKSSITGQVAYSQDGQKYAYYDHVHELEIFDFDRCTGIFSNSTHIILGNNSEGGGVAFSPNSQVLYVPSINYVYQFDVTAPNIAATQTIVAVWDTFYSPQPPFATYFYLAQLAPDGKIYLVTGNSTQHLHVINQPDVLGMGCDLQQHSFVLPTLNFNTLPNHPNYFLGADSGSVCDTIVTTVDVFEPPEIQIKTFPNPSNGIFTLGFPTQNEQGVLEIYDVLGNLILKENVAQWSQYKRVNIFEVSTGIYLCKISWGEKNANVKILKE